MFRPSHSSHSAGFTLIELLIVVAIIAVIAAAAIPNLLASRLTANESSAISTLRTVISAQAQAQNRVSVDVDADGRGEYLYLGELSGAANLRGAGLPLDPAAVSASLGIVNNAVVTKSGYLFAMYLPGPANEGVPEDANGGKAAAGAVNADMAETFWVCYAWPGSLGTTGRRAFVANQTGDLLQTNNNQGYDGQANVPPAHAAYTQAADITSPYSIGGAPAAAQDGGVWLSIN